MRAARSDGQFVDTACYFRHRNRSGRNPVHATRDLDGRGLQPRSDTMATRIEKDFLGEKQIPDDAYYGVQTLRGKENFHITGIPMSLEPNFVKAFGYVKKAAALANRDLGVLDAEGRRRDRRRLRPTDRRRDARPVRHRLHPGWRRHVDQHERERGDRQPRAGGARPPERRVPVRQSERPRELRAVDQRHLPDRLPAGADPAG